MKLVFTDLVITRLDQLVFEIHNACDGGLDFHDRLREFKRYCDSTPPLAQCLTELPPTAYNFSVDWRDIPSHWREGVEGYAMRWDAIGQMVEFGDVRIERAWMHVGINRESDALRRLADLFVVPIHHFLLDQLARSSAMLYALLRFKRRAEWFKADDLRKRYGQPGGSGGEAALDQDLRCFLFESGIDYPFSQPASPRGSADIVADLETDDPLVMEIKVWDSKKGYRANRVRDGLRQAMDYSSRYGKDRGYIVVFNLDQEPLAFLESSREGEWPPCLEHGGRTYYFIEVHIAEILKPISQTDKGKPVRTNDIILASLLDD